MTSTHSTLLTTLLVGCSLLQVVNGQELPNPLYEIDQFNTTVNFRQNVCDIQAKLDREEMALEDALAGMQLRTVNAISQYFRLDPVTGGIDEEYPGLTAVLLDELARRGRFTWRDSYATTEEPIEGRTWTDLLEWTTETYDVSVDWWAHSIQRMSMGINFPEGWYDASIIMVGKKDGSTDDKIDVWSWLDPFDWSVWLLILFTVFLSGFLYYFLENIDPKSDRRNLKKDPIENMFYSWLLFTGHYDFHPRTNPAQLFSASLSFWALLSSSAYIANLASFMVVKNNPNIQVSSVADAVRGQYPICVHDSTQGDEALSRAYPNANIVRKSSEVEMFEAVLNGDCDVAVTTVYGWQFWERNAGINGSCELAWIGRTFQFVPAGFATISDAGTRCTSIIRDVLNIHFLKMKEEEFIDKAWKEHLERTATVDCSDSQSTVQRQVEGAQQLTIKDMGGIFIVHYGVCFLAILYAYIYKVFGYQKARDEKNDKERMEKNLAKVEKAKSMMNVVKAQKSSRRLLDGVALSDVDENEAALSQSVRSNRPSLTGGRGGGRPSLTGGRGGGRGGGRPSLAGSSGYGSSLIRQPHETAPASDGPSSPKSPEQGFHSSRSNFNQMLNDVEHNDNLLGGGNDSRESTTDRLLFTALTTGNDDGTKDGDDSLLSDDDFEDDDYDDNVDEHHLVNMIMNDRLEKQESLRQQQEQQQQQQQQQQQWSTSGRFLGNSSTPATITISPNHPSVSAMKEEMEEMKEQIANILQLVTETYCDEDMDSHDGEPLLQPETANNSPSGDRKETEEEEEKFPDFEEVTVDDEDEVDDRTQSTDEFKVYES